MIRAVFDWGARVARRREMRNVCSATASSVVCRSRRGHELCLGMSASLTGDTVTKRRYTCLMTVELGKGHVPHPLRRVPYDTLSLPRKLRESMNQSDIACPSVDAMMPTGELSEECVQNPVQQGPI